MAERPITQDGNVVPVEVKGMAAQECIALADMMQLQLGQKETDVLDQLVNNDFEGKFFAIGDTVQVVAINPNSIKVVEGDKNDVRPTLDALSFSMNTMTIDKQRAYAFQIKDLERLEDRWNHESAAHALAARKMRQAACIDVLELITTNNQVAHIGDTTTPVDLTAEGVDPGKKLFALVNRMLEYLNTTGAVDGKEYTYGTNKTVPMRGTPSLFLAPGIHRILLDSQYTRVDDVTEDVIRNGKYEKFNGCLLNAAPALDSEYGVHVSLLDDKSNIGIIVLGTKNAVTRAGKVLPPEKMRDYVKFADNYYGREIYGRMIASAESVIYAVVKYGDEFSELFNAPASVEPDAKLFANYKEETPVRQNSDGFNPNEGYANAEGVTISEVDGLAAALEGKATSTHIHTFDVTGEAQTDVETSAPAEPEGD